MFTYTVSDGAGTTDTATLTITVKGVGPVGSADTATATESQTLSVNAAGGVLTNDTGGDTESLAVTNIESGGTGNTGTAGQGVLGTYGTLTIAADGIIDAIQLKIRHDIDIDIELTKDALISEMHTVGNETNIIIVAPEGDNVLEADGEVEILELIAANSNGEIQIITPEEFALIGAFPNPFNPSTNLNYTISDNGYLEINIHDVRGRLVESLYADYTTAGEHAIKWNAEMYSSGVYLAQFKYKSRLKTQKLMLMK